MIRIAIPIGISSLRDGGSFNAERMSAAIRSVR
jgi:hypothetical protein